MKGHTGGKSSDENPMATCWPQNGLLVVKLRRDVHKQIRRLIGHRRQFK